MAGDGRPRYNIVAAEIHMPSEQASLPMLGVHNSGLFSNHWLENRLPLEPDWIEQRSDTSELEMRYQKDFMVAICCALRP